MAHRFSEITFTPTVVEAQQQFGTAQQMARLQERMPDFNCFSDKERSFISARESFYLASVNEDGWPYIQHKGGTAGFLKVISETQLAYVSVAGNGQYQSLGNLAHSDKVALFLMDYAKQRRLKVLGRASYWSLPELPEQWQAYIEGVARAEALVVIDLEAFDWNCPQYITPRFTLEELDTRAK